MKDDKQREPTAIDGFTAGYPEIFNFFKTLYAKRKTELRARLENRPTKEEKETLLADERKTVTADLESHPLFGLYNILNKPFSDTQKLFDTFLSVMPQTINAISTEADLKAAEAVQFVIDKHLQGENNNNKADFNEIMKKLAEIPESSEAIKNIANTKDSIAAFAYHLLKMEGDNQYLKYIIRTYEELQAGKIITVESKRQVEKPQLPALHIDQGDLEDLIQNSVRQVLSEQSLEEKEPADEIMSTEQAGRYLNLAVQTIYGFTSKNEIPFFKRGKKLYFKRSELEQWLLEGKQKTIKETQKEAIDYINKRKK